MLPRIPHWPLLLAPTLAFVLGFTMNCMAIAANRGTMPVLEWHCESDDTMDDGIHSCMTPKTHLKFLCDWIHIRGVGIASPGDFLIDFRTFFFWPGMIGWVLLMLRDRRMRVY